MKYKLVGLGLVKLGRTPHGVRGLKYEGGQATHREGMSHPSRGAWIEIQWSHLCFHRPSVAPLTGCVD